MSLFCSPYYSITHISKLPHGKLLCYALLQWALKTSGTREYHFIKVTSSWLLNQECHNFFSWHMQSIEEILVLASLIDEARAFLCTEKSIPSIFAVT